MQLCSPNSSNPDRTTLCHAFATCFTPLPSSSLVHSSVTSILQLKVSCYSHSPSTLMAHFTQTFYSSFSRFHQDTFHCRQSPFPVLSGMTHAWPTATSHRSHVEKGSQGTPFSQLHAPHRPVTHCWSNTTASLTLSPPTRQITELSWAKQNTVSCAMLWGKVPSLSNQFAAQSTRFTTCFMSTHTNIDLICPRYWVLLKLRPGLTLVTYFFSNIYYWNNLFLRVSQSQLAFWHRTLSQCRDNHRRFCFPLFPHPVLSIFKTGICPWLEKSATSFLFKISLLIIVRTPQWLCGGEGAKAQQEDDPQNSRQWSTCL